uniref:polynucleotide adenylyltransferase n=1 Tax=Panagrolaimus superbus TaxID=310955 RepID=A0A914YTU0_9BILA
MLNGGAATHCLANEQFNYTDVDLIFPISLANEDDFDKVRNAVFDVLFSLMPIATTRTSTSADAIRDVYISKMVKVCSEDDRWSLFSLHNDYGKCIELKFCDRMRRQFEFSVDSFQITLDRLLDTPNEVQPKIIAESVYGDIRQALSHLNSYMIDTRNPEEIRGGGLLKYCHLITRGYNATQNCRNMEKYMCSRFFIDFSDIHTQEMKLHQYLENHFGSEDQMKLHYLQVLHKVIKESTICLMGHERRQTLNMVDRLRINLEYGMMYLNIACSGDESSSSTSGMSSPAPPSTVSSDSSTTSNNVMLQGTFATSPGRSTLLYLAPNSHFWVPVA